MWQNYYRSFQSVLIEKVENCKKETRVEVSECTMPLVDDQPATT